MKKLTSFILLSFFLLAVKTSAQTWQVVGGGSFATGAEPTNIALDHSGTPYVVFEDSAYNFKATVKKYNGTSWVTVGTAGFTADTAANPSIAIDASGSPYIVFGDAGHGGKASVMIFNGSSWIYVGSPGFSAGVVYSYYSIAVTGAGTPYVVYSDLPNDYKATCMKFDGTSWVAVGSVGFSTGPVNFTSIALDPSGTPYVVYADYDGFHFYGATVMKFNGTSWTLLGTTGFSAGFTSYDNIAVDGSGTPYVIYQDAANGNYATVMKYNGISWVNVGPAGFSAGSVSYTTIAIDGGGTPYAAYVDYGTTGYKSTVMKFNGTSWTNVGTPGFSSDTAYFTSMALSSSGTPYVAMALGSAYNATVMRTDIGAITGTFTVCPGATTYLTDLSTGGIWSSSNTGVATVGSTGVVTGVAGGTAAISYTSMGISAAAVVTVIPFSAGSLTGSTSMVCVGATITVGDTVSGGVWSSNDPGVATIGSSTGIVTGVSAGSALISYAVTGTCGTIYASEMVLVTTVPPAGTILGTLSVCSGASVTLFDPSAPSGGTWISSNMAVGTVGSISGAVTGIATGTTVISYAISNTCGTNYATATVTVNPMSSGGVISGPSTVCSGGTIDLSDTPSGGVWSSSNPGVATIGSSSGVVSGVSSGTTTISYSAPGTCGTTVSTKIITVSSAAAAGTIMGPSFICVGTSDTLSDVVTGGAWTTTNSSAIISAGGVLHGFYAGTDTVVYTVTFTCVTTTTATATTVITVVPTPVAGVITGANTVCVNDTITLVDAAGGGVWSAGNSNAFINSGGLVLGITAGADEITYSVTNDCGTATAAHTVYIKDCSAGISNVSSPGQDVTLYPNPVQDVITVTSSVPINKIVISNLVGEQLFSGSYSNTSAVVKLSQLPAGIYIARINGAVVRKFVKE